MRFVDTDVLLYAVSRSPAELPKAEAARELLDHRDLGGAGELLALELIQSYRDRDSREERHVSQRC